MSYRIKLGESAVSALWYLLLVVALPVATVAVFGLIYLWQQNLLLLVVVIWLVISIVAYTALIYVPKLKAGRLPKQDAPVLPNVLDSKDIEDIPERLNARGYWSEQDHDIWDRSCLSIEARLLEQLDWDAMPDAALKQLALIAEQYHGMSKNAQYQFTVPELLLVLSVTSIRYRQVVIDYLPYVDQISVAKVNSIFDQKGHFNTGYRWFNRLRRTARLINPASAVVGEIRDVITDKIFTQASTALQTDFKRLLLQEVTQVGIDLYSGKLSATEIELAGYQSNASKQDEQRSHKPVEPTRVLLLGQTSAGKSSLINALTLTLQAEVGVLPVTSNLTVHELRLEGELIISLIDTPGLDGTHDTCKQIVNAALDADLIVWCVKATQPARAPDHQLYVAMQDHYTNHPERLQAPIILTLTHIDQLSPKNQWDPPYDLEGTHAKAISISAVIDSARSQIELPSTTLAVPICLSHEFDHYNIDVLAAQIMMLSDTSANVQLNRRRLELGTKSKDWREHWAQAKKLGLFIGQSIVSRR